MVERREDHPHGDRPQRPDVRHEPSDVSVRGILWFAAGLVVLAVAVHVGLAWMYSVLARQERERKASQFPLAAEERARTDLGMIQAGETFYQIAPAAPPAER